MSSISPTSRTMALETLRNLSVVLGPLASTSLRSVLRFLPTATKYLLWFLLLINARSLPLVWHWRVFLPSTRLRLQYRLLRLQFMFKPRAAREIAEARWFDSLTPVGANPFESVVTYTSWASLDDSDFNGHLSNSSYAKTLDSARFKAALAWFPHFFRTGGWMPLAGTHYQFIREIPMLTKYEVRISIGSWDNKWLYVICKFVSKPKSKKDAPKRKPIANPSPTSNTMFNASLRTPADEISTSVTPMPTETPVESTPENTANAMKAIAAGLLHTEEPDGAILHTLSISQLCFKQGRITVPPAIVLASNGFSLPPAEAINGSGNSHSKNTPAAYSHSNPPPHWPLVKSLMSKPAGGSLKALQTLLKGGWRDVPEDQRWWERALGGSMEEQRKGNLEVLNEVRRGMEGARGI